MHQGSKLFREEALERLSSPEQLDKLMRVVSPQTWLPLVSMGCLVVAGGVWSVVGRIPLTVTGTGVLIRPGHIVPFQASTAGQLLSLNIKPGDRVKIGQVLATIDQSAVKQELELEKAKLAELQGQKQNTDRLQKQQVAQELKTLEQQTQLKELEVQKTNTERDYIQSLNKVDDLKNSIQELKLQKTTVERDYRQSLNKIDEIKTKIKDIEAQKTQLTQ